MQKFILGVAKDSPIQLFLDVHASAQTILYPDGITDTRESERIKRVADKASQAIMDSNSNSYPVISSFNLYNQTTYGCLDNWAYKVGGSEYSYTFELAMDDGFSFLCPPDKIVEHAKDFWIGVRAMVKEITNVL